MRFAKYGAAAVFTIGVSLWAAGCTTSTPATPATGGGEHAADEHGHEGHDHEGHDHGHEGPHGGHLVEADNEDYHFEWTHSEDGLVTVYVLDASAKKERSIAAAEIAIDVKIGAKQQSFKLPAVDPADEKAAKFEITDKQLLGVLEALDPKSQGVTATIVATIAGLEKPVTAKIEAHEHTH